MTTISRKKEGKKEKRGGVGHHPKKGEKKEKEKRGNPSPLFFRLGDEIRM